jgi:hypothetical protein
MARALGISTHELRICIAENRVGAALLERFREPENTTDIASGLIGSAPAREYAGAGEG